MIEVPMKRWKCRSCDEISIHRDLLLAPNPFNPDDTLVGCPKCRQADDGFREICDEPGCRSEANCGFTARDGSYRRTCFDHSNFKKETP